MPIKNKLVDEFEKESQKIEYYKIIKSIRDNTSNLRDAFKIIRSNADRISKLEDNHEVLLARLETLELKVEEIVKIVKHLEEWI